MAELAVARLPRLAELFHRAALDGDWRSALHESSSVLGAEGIALIGAPFGRAGANHSEGVDELVDRFVAERWYLRNPRMDAALRLGIRATSVSTEWSLFSPREREILPFNGAFIKKLGFGPFLGAALGQREGNAIILSIERKHEQGSYSLDDVARFRSVLPSLQQATRVSMALNDARDAGLMDGLERAGRAAMLLDHAGCAFWISTRARPLLDGALGAGATGLVATHRPSADRLQAAITDALRFPAVIARRGRVVVEREAARPLLVDVAPLRDASDDLLRRAKAIVLIDDPDAVVPPDEAVCRMIFGLTPSEAAVAVRIAAGVRPLDVARELRISLGTLRIHLKAVFAKTGVHRQAELAALLGRVRSN